MYSGLSLNMRNHMRLQLKSLIICIFLIFGFASVTLHAEDTKASSWDVLTDEFALNHEIQHPEVQKQLKWYKNHPEDVQKMADQAKPYLYHILNEIKKRNMPGELALIPMIESEYDPFASSNAGAAGIWQITPHTGMELGLTRNWWVDGRRSIGPSTNAALNYLNHLHHFFHGNWILAVAAYDSGEGRVSKAVKRGKKSLFWSLHLPHETKAYVPRLLALSEIIKNPARYHIRLPKIPHEPYFKEVNINNRIDINHAAKLTKTPNSDLHRLNPGFKDWSTRPSKPYTLLIPKEHVDDFYKNLANITSDSAKHVETSSNQSKQKKSKSSKYIVKKGDTLSHIAHQHHLKLSALKELNPHIIGKRPQPGQTLNLSGG
jgi:membrane-bound lytic murein transglycosylase D